MSPVHVCLMNDSFPPIIDGVANTVVNYATIIQRSYGSAAVATPYYPENHDGDYPFPIIRYPSLDTTSLVGYRAGNPLSPETFAQLNRLPIDLIHSHCPVSSTILARLYRSERKVPLVMTYHTKFDIDIANAVRGKLLQESAIKLLVENISACDEVWVVSHGAGENLRSLGFEGEYRVMPNGVDLPRGRVSEELIARATADYDLPAGVPLFLFVGRMMWYKGLRIILDALKTLQGGGQDFRMVFIGGGGDMDEVRAYTAQLGLEGQCFFTGPLYERDSIRAWYCRADLFLFPSTFDTNGLVVREAAACGLASVLVKGSCAAEDSTDGQNGFFIQENADSMAECLRRLCANPESVRRAGEAAQRELYMSWEDSVKNACERYETVIDNYARGLYPARRAVSEELLRSVAAILEAMQQSRERRGMRKAFRRESEQLTQGISELAAGLDWERSRLRRELGSEIPDDKPRLKQLWEKLERFM